MAVLTVGMAQMDIVLGDAQRNSTQLHGFAEEAQAKHVDVLVLPELWSTGYMLEQAADLASSVGEGIFATMAGVAKKYRLALAGSVLMRHGDAVKNTAVFYDSDGTLRSTYSKLHLFGLMQEDQFLTPGDTAPIFDSVCGKTAMAICYDLRFPELFRSYAVRGAEVVIMPSEWPYPRLGHWQTLVRARAIENQCFVVACNRVGDDRASQFCGHSMVVNPWGEVLIEAEETPGLFITQIDVGDVAEVRGRMSVLRDRRPDMYV